MPSLFDGSNATDLYTLSENLGKTNMTARMNAHREAFIRESDFAWLAANGVNGVRVPIGYWDVIDSTVYDIDLDMFPTGEAH